MVFLGRFLISGSQRFCCNASTSVRRALEFLCSGFWDYLWGLKHKSCEKSLRNESCVCVSMQVCVGVRTPRIQPLSMLGWAGEIRGGMDAGRLRTMTPSCSSPWVWVGGTYLQFSPRKDPPSHPHILEMPTCPGTLSPHLSPLGRNR